MKPLKTIEDTKTKKPKYVVKVKDKISEYFPKRYSKEFTSMGATLYGNEIVKENIDFK